MFFLPEDRQRAKRTETAVNQILNRIHIMPTNEDLNTELSAVETTLTQEIQEIADALAAAGTVPQATIDRVVALKNRIAGIVNPPEQPPA